MVEPKINNLVRNIYAKEKFNNATPLAPCSLKYIYTHTHIYIYKDDGVSLRNVGTPLIIIHYRFAIYKGYANKYKYVV